VKHQKSNKQVIVDFIVSRLEKGEQRATILAKVVKKWQSSVRTFDRLLKIANEQYSNRLHLASKAADDTYVAMKAEAAKEAVMSKQEREEYLTKLIKGDIEIPYTEVKWNPVSKSFETIQFVELASHGARISAISELNKMGGDYAPSKVAQTDKDGNDVPAPKTLLSDDQFSKLLDKLNA
jgi:hypothetical protein